MVRCEPHKEIKLIIMKCSVRKIIVVNDRNIISRHVHYVYACVYANVYKQYIWVATRTSSSSVTDPSRGGEGVCCSILRMPCFYSRQMYYFFLIEMIYNIILLNKYFDVTFFFMYIEYKSYVTYHDVTKIIQIETM